MPKKGKPKKKKTSLEYYERTTDDPFLLIITILGIVLEILFFLVFTTNIDF